MTTSKGSGLQQSLRGDLPSKKRKFYLIMKKSYGIFTYTEINPESKKEI